MPEQLPKEKTKEGLSEDFDVLAEAALDSGIKANLPALGTPAYVRLFGICKKYSDAVHADVVGEFGGHIVTGKYRRDFHEKLCKMLFGTDYDNTSGDNIAKASNFAHLVAGREQYIT